MPQHNFTALIGVIKNNSPHSQNFLHMHRKKCTDGLHHHLVQFVVESITEGCSNSPAHHLGPSVTVQVMKGRKDPKRLNTPKLLSVLPAAEWQEVQDHQDQNQRQRRLITLHLHCNLFFTLHFTEINPPIFV